MRRGTAPARPSLSEATSAKPPASRPESVSPARKAAFRVLLEVGAGSAHSDELLHASGPGAALAGLSEADRGLAMTLVMGVLRWQIALDARLQRLFSRPGSTMADEVMVSLRLGALQLLHTDRIPPHAALSESVAMVRAAGHEYATGMVNAVLRRLAGEPKTEPARVYESPAAMAQRLAHPVWLIERWVSAFGRAAVIKICEADQHEPQIAGVLAPSETLPMMDEGSRLIGEMAAAVVRERPEPLRVWDCCAAPGGKTAVLAERLPGAEVLATDRNGRRLALMEERLGGRAVSAGLGGPVRCLMVDAAHLPIAEGSFDLVLCDAPCSGTGTLGRNPEIRLRLQPQELRRQSARQGEILKAAMARVKQGGRLVYSTCSLEPEENEDVIEEALKTAGPEWRRLDAGEILLQLRTDGILLAGLNDAVRAGDLRTLPGVHPVDGFYAAILERRS